MAIRKRTSTTSAETTQATTPTTRSIKAAVPATPAPEKRTPRVNEPAIGNLQEVIRLRAYQLFLQEGCQHGHDVEHWLRAEAETMGRYGTAFGSGARAASGHSVQ